MEKQPESKKTVEVVSPKQTAEKFQKQEKMKISVEQQQTIDS